LKKGNFEAENNLAARRKYRVTGFKSKAYPESTFPPPFPGLMGALTGAGIEDPLPAKNAGVLAVFREKKIIPV
jgi:hypothetical protein